MIAFARPPARTCQQAAPACCCSVSPPPDGFVVVFGPMPSECPECSEILDMADKIAADVVERLRREGKL